MAKGVFELLWIKNLLQELKISLTSLMKLYCDNKAACNIAHNPVQHDRTKHVETDKHFIKEQLEVKIIEVPDVRSQDQLADILTKTISSKVFHQVLSKLGMKNVEDCHSYLLSSCDQILVLYVYIMFISQYSLGTSLYKGL